MTLKEFSGILEGICKNTAHYGAADLPFPRIVYFETGREYEWADNKIIRRTYKVDVHLFTKDPFDALINTLEDVLAENGVAFDLSFIDHGDDEAGKKDITGYHYTCII